MCYFKKWFFNNLLGNTIGETGWRIINIWWTNRPQLWRRT